MKKLLYILLFIPILLSGCEKKLQSVASAKLFKMEGEKTAAGIVPGDNSKAFIKAYKDYPIQVAYTNLTSNFMVMSIESIPYDEEITTMIANFFIDGDPVSEETLCKENHIEYSELHSLLSSPKYLRSHNVKYRYLNFRWEHGVISEIVSDELNYNEIYETPRIPK